jgi:hypothetical protein
MHVNHLSFTGTQNALTNPQKEALFRELQWLRNKGFEWLHHGDCIGADLAAHNMWRELGGKLWIHPPIDFSKRAFAGMEMGDRCEPERDYLKRNMDVVQCGQQLLACSKGMTEERRSGTWATVRYARTLKRPRKIILPDGRILMEGFGW